MTEEKEFKYRIPLFDGMNFGNWKFRMDTLLNELELTNFIQKEFTDMVEFNESDTAAVKKEKEKQLSDFGKNDKKCRSQIIQRIAVIWNT